MSGPLVEVDGLRQLRRSLRAAGDDLTSLKDTNRQVAQLVTNRVRAPTLTGALARTVRPAGTTTAAIIRAGRAKVPYAGPIHWGWKRRNIPANPFLTTAAQDTEPTWIEVYHRHLTTILATIEGAS